MLELLCGRSPPGPPPRGDSGRAVLGRPPCALHERILALVARPVLILPDHEGQLSNGSPGRCI